MNVNEIETNQLKLSYEEISPCSESAATSWKMILDKGDVPVDRKVLLDAVKAGESFNRSQLWRVFTRLTRSSLFIFRNNPGLTFLGLISPLLITRW